MTIQRLFPALASCLLALLPAHASVMVMEPAPAQQVPAHSAHPYLDSALYPQWSRMTPGQGAEDLRLAFADARQRMEAICCVPAGEETYENTFAAYERMTDDLYTAYGLFGMLCTVMDSPERRSVQEAILPELAAFSTSVTSSERLWAVIKRAAAAPWVQALPAELQRYVQQVVDSFRDSGAELSAEG